MEHCLCTSQSARHENSMNTLLPLPLEEADGIAHFGGQARQRRLADLRHPGIALLNHYPGSICLERSISRERVDKGLSPVIDAAYQYQFSFVADEHCALQVSHV